MELAEVRAALLDPSAKLTIVDEDPEEAQRRIVQRTLDAASLDDIWGGTVVHAKDCVNRAFRLTDVEFRNSEIDENDREGGLSIYAVMHVAFCDTGETAVVTSGATGVVTRLVKLIEFGALPIEVLIASSKTKGNYTVYDLAPAPQGF